MATRRHILASGGVALSVPATGCLGTFVDGFSGTDDETITPVSRSPSHPEDDCGPAVQPLSALLTHDTGDPGPCYDGAMPPLAVENERDESVTVDLEFDTANGFEETYTLDAGERIVERSAFEAQRGIAGTVSVDDGQVWDVEWPERSCYQYGIALLSNDIEIGWIEPIQGPGDTQHDCYPGRAIPVEVGTVGEDRTITVTIVNRCTETTKAETITVSAGERERITDGLVSGGFYSITVEAKDGTSGTREFDEVCWGVIAGVEEDGEIVIEQLAID